MIIHGGDIYRNKVDIDFSVNLNPLGIQPEIRDAIARSAELAGVYPDPGQEEVRAVIADAEGLSPECVYAGAGASELIQAAVRAKSPVEALLYEPSFYGYERALDGIGCRIRRHMLRGENRFSVMMDDVAASDGCDIVFVCDPACPSGANIDDEVLCGLLDKAESAGTSVVLDESFYLLSEKAREGGNRAAKLLGRYSCLYIIRSMTKILSVPGIRAGYVMSSPEKIRKIAAQLPEWNLSAAAAEVIKAGMRLACGTDFPEKTLDAVRTEREYLAGELSDMGYEVIDSDSSYILFYDRGERHEHCGVHGGGPTDSGLYGRLLSEGILIRDCSTFAGLGKGWYRLAVKRHEDNVRLAKTLRRIIHGY